MKYIRRNLEYYLIGIPAWTIHELSHIMMMLIIKLTYFIHLTRLYNLKIECFKFSSKECRLTFSYTTDMCWPGIIVSLAPRMMYIIFPIILFLIGNPFITMYGMIIMTRPSFDMSYRDKYSMLKLLKRIKEIKQEKLTAL